MWLFSLVTVYELVPFSVLVLRRGAFVFRKLNGLHVSKWAYAFDDLISLYLSRKQSAAAVPSEFFFLPPPPPPPPPSSSFRDSSSPSPFFLPPPPRPTSTQGMLFFFVLPLLLLERSTPKDLKRVQDLALKMLLVLWMEKDRVYKPSFFKFWVFKYSHRVVWLIYCYYSLTFILFTFIQMVMPIILQKDRKIISAVKCLDPPFELYGFCSFLNHILFIYFQKNFGNCFL